MEVGRKIMLNSAHVFVVVYGMAFFFIISLRGDPSIYWGRRRKPQILEPHICLLPKMELASLGRAVVNLPIVACGETEAVSDRIEAEHSYKPPNLLGGS